MGARLSVVLGLFCLLVTPAFGPTAAASEPIAWSADRPLRWEDFTGPVVGAVSPENVARAATSLGWSYAYRLEWSRDRCSFSITDIQSLASFHPDESWVRAGYRTDAILEHEQGHFDITRIHQLMFDERARPLVGTDEVCAGRNQARITAFVEQRIGEVVGTLYEQVWLDHTRVQQAYDAGTGHGTDTAAQAVWTRRIQAGLRGERWEEFAAAGTRDAR